MCKVSIKVIELGNTKERINKNILKNFKSKFFKIESFGKIASLAKPQTNRGTLDIVYTRNEVVEMLKDEKFDGVLVGIINYGFIDKFYMHRIRPNAMVISLYGIKEILNSANIDLENFIIKCIYEGVCYYKASGDLVSEEIYNFVHSDTRRCLFDLNGDRADIVYNTEKPIICDECKGKLNKMSLPDNFIEELGRELKRIDKSLLKKIELFIEEYPLLSFTGAIIVSFILNIFSNFIYDILRGKF